MLDDKYENNVRIADLLMDDLSDCEEDNQRDCGDQRDEIFLEDSNVFVCPQSKEVDEKGSEEGKISKNAIIKNESQIQTV